MPDHPTRLAGIEASNVFGVHRRRPRIHGRDARANPRGQRTPRRLRRAGQRVDCADRAARRGRGRLARGARAEDLGRPRCVMIHPAVLPEPQMACLRQLAPIATALDFYLAGGTAVALHLGHRRSMDFDWFANRFPGQPVDLQASFAARGIGLEPTALAERTVHGQSAGVKVSIVTVWSVKLATTLVGAARFTPIVRPACVFLSFVV